MSIREAIEIVINQLNGINVPVGLLQQIGFPINQAVDNLRACVEAIDRDTKNEVEENTGEK